MGRPTWDETWMQLALDVARRSICDGAQVGAVIVDANERVISTGYNGPPRNFPRPVDSRCSGFCPRRQNRDQGLSYGLSCPSIHAEANALLFADRRDFEGGTIYVTRACCQDCSKLIANSGLKRVVMRKLESDLHRDPDASVKFMESCGLVIEVHDYSHSVI